MTASSPAERINDLMLQLETERHNAISALCLAMDNLETQARTITAPKVFPAGIAEEARQLYEYLHEAGVRFERLRMAEKP